MAKQAAVLTFIVVHGSISGKKVGESVEMTQEDADHINSSGKMLRREDEPEEGRERAESGTRVGLDGKKREVKLQGKVIETTADTEPFEEPGAPAEEEPTTPVRVKKLPGTKAKKPKAGG